MTSTHTLWKEGKSLTCGGHVQKKSIINQHYQYVPQDLNNPNIPNTRPVPMLDGLSSTYSGIKGPRLQCQIPPIVGPQNASEARGFPPKKSAVNLYGLISRKAGTSVLLQEALK